MWCGGSETRDQRPETRAEARKDTQSEDGKQTEQQGGTHIGSPLNLMGEYILAGIWLGGQDRSSIRRINSCLELVSGRGGEVVEVGGDDGKRTLGPT